MKPADLLSRRLAATYLTVPWVVGLVIAANSLAFLVGVEFYLTTLSALPTWLWPLYGDSPTAIALATLVIAGLLPAAQSGVRPHPGLIATHASEANEVYAVVSTLAVVWLVETGLWTVLALNVPLVRPDLPADLYVGFGPSSLWAYWGILITHAAFLLEAALVAHVARSSRRALAVALVAVLANDLFDYGSLVGLPFANHPPLRYDPGPLLAVVSVCTSLVAVGVAALVLSRN